MAGLPWVACRRVRDRSQCVCSKCGGESAVGDGAEPGFMAAHAGCGGSSGLGDLVAAVAAPVARALGMEGCLPCARKRAALNRAFPLR